MSDPSIAFIDTSAHPSAIPYYGTFPNEPIPPAGGSDTVLISGKTVDVKHRRTETLLENIAKNAKPGGSILIVSHGNDAGLIFSIGDPKGRTLLQSDALSIIRLNADGKMTDAETAKRLVMSEANFVKFKAQIAAVQKLQLDRVDLRACKVGKNEVTMSRFQVFFNCNTLCAPKIYDAYGPMNFGKPTGAANFWSKWLDNNKGAMMQGTPPDRFAWHAAYTPNFTIDALAESDTAVKNWAASHLPSGNYSGGPLFFHAFTDDVSKLIFAGDEGFRANLAQAYKGKEPSRTIDVTNMPLLPE